MELYTRRCYSCTKIKSLDEFYKKKNGKRYQCKSCFLIESNKREKIKRQKVIDYYGGKCNCCGESVYEFLSIDHVNNNGAEHRRNISERRMSRWIINNNYPEGFQILCHNCNFAKGMYKKCPHNG